MAGVDEFIEGLARVLAREGMPPNMAEAPSVTQSLYIDATWRKYVPAARASIDYFKRREKEGSNGR